MIPGSDPLAAMRLDGRLAVVTGGGLGIGRAAATLFARVDAIVVVADIDAAAARSVAAAIGRTAHAVQVDVADPAAIDRLADAAAAIAPIGVWANVAGIAGHAPIGEATRASFDRIVAVNLAGVHWGCAAAARHMIPNGAGSIVNISSNAADQPMPGLSLYAMTKAGVNMLTRSLAVELGPHGIRVNAVAPGFTRTAMTTPAGLDDDDPAASSARRGMSRWRCCILHRMRGDSSPARSGA